MQTHWLWFVFAIALCFIVGVCDGLAAPSLRETITSLKKTIIDSRFKQDKPFVPPMEWMEIEGLYPSYIHFNLAGEDIVSVGRREVKIMDNNGFVASFVLAAMLESYSLGEISLSDDDVLPTVKAILSFRDKNMAWLHGGNVPIYSFWPQKLKTNGNVSAYVAWATNLAIGAADEGGFAGFLHKVLQKMGLEVVWDKVFEPLQDSINTMMGAFEIPADTDDTGCNLYLDAMLRQHKKTLPASWAAWSSVNMMNVSGILARAHDVAWIPSERQIDPRTYYLFYDYVVDHPHCEYLPTWFLTFEEDKKLHPLVSMPFQVNNVDLNVGANFVFGIISQYSAEAFSLSDEDVTLIQCTLDFIAHALVSDIPTSRPDIALVYYPSLYDFYFFVSRLVNLLESVQHQLPSSLQPSVLDFMNTVKLHVTDSLLHLVGESDDGAHWDDFLGNGDWPVHHYDDRLFSTSLALNSLILLWHDSAPSNVSAIVHSAARWLNIHVLKGDYLPMNAFFSGSVKGMSSLPFFYPSTYDFYLNGTKADMSTSSSITSELVCSVDRLIPVDDYERMIHESWYQVDVPTTYHGFNKDVFPLWSSAPMTYSMSILALSRYLALYPQR